MLALAEVGPARAAIELEAGVAGSGVCNSGGGGLDEGRVEFLYMLEP